MSNPVHAALGELETISRYAFTEDAAAGKEAGAYSQTTVRQNYAALVKVSTGLDHAGLVEANGPSTTCWAMP